MSIGAASSVVLQSPLGHKRCVAVGTPEVSVGIVLGNLMVAQSSTITELLGAELTDVLVSLLVGVPDVLPGTRRGVVSFGASSQRTLIESRAVIQIDTIQWQVPEVGGASCGWTGN